MICPFCRHEEDKVVDSRMSGTSIRRRRECLSCGRRFTTYEYVEVMPLTVVKRDNRREAFQRDKLERGIKMSCIKRPVSIDTVKQIVDNVENHLVAQGGQEVGYDQIGNLVMQELREVDSVAYVRFASVYRQFEEVGDFVEQVRSLENPA